jgi:thiol:disulfide interchange protein
VVELRDAKGRVRRAEIDLPVGGAKHVGVAAGAGSDDAAATSPLVWLQVVFFALLGGLILNGMPCVLPVLAIKIVSVADMAERDPREVRLHGLAYTTGVLGSMLVLACLVLSLRFAGHAVGWGFQFQEPLFVAGIAALLVTFALNLFGVFEIELGQGRLATVGQDASGLSRSVFEGLLAVVLATPCTAPFLGTAVGFAFASSGYGIVAIFLAIGAGLASPFLLVSFFPRLARFIPRSGPWMLKLRAGLGFCLLATVIWLLWIVGQSGGSDAVVAMTAALLFLAFLLWSYGQMQPMRSLWLGRASAVAIAGLAFASFNLIDFERAAHASPPATGDGDEAAIQDDGFAPYSEAAVQDALARGLPAFVVFTADWCITCKVNEKTVLDRPAVRNALQRGGYALFKADWTRRDDAIRAKLAEFGRAGVPLYLVYDPALPAQPRVLSELLTQDAVVTALAEMRRTDAI